MAKFKIGDRVKNLEDDYYVKLGEIGTIDEDDDCPFVIWDRGERFAQEENLLQLVAEAQPIPS